MRNHLIGHRVKIAEKLADLRGFTANRSANFCKLPAEFRADRKQGNFTVARPVYELADVHAERPWVRSKQGGTVTMAHRRAANALRRDI